MEWVTHLKSSSSNPKYFEVNPDQACFVFSRFFWIDDVYVGGVLPQKLGIPRTRFWHGHGTDVMRPSHASGSIVDYIFLMAGNNEFMTPLWHRLWKAVIMNSLDM